jgi:hypothetical protein
VVIDKTDDMVGFLVLFKGDIRPDLDPQDPEDHMIWNVTGLDRFKASKIYTSDVEGLQGCTVTDGEVLRDISRTSLILSDAGNANRAVLGHRYEQHLI